MTKLTKWVAVAIITKLECENLLNDKVSRISDLLWGEPTAFAGLYEAVEFIRRYVTPRQFTALSADPDQTHERIEQLMDRVVRDVLHSSPVYVHHKDQKNSKDINARIVYDLRAEYCELLWSEVTSINVVGAEYRDKVNGNSYNSVRIRLNGQLWKVLPFDYGYEHAYLDRAFEVIRESFNLTDMSHFVCNDHGIKLTKLMIKGYSQKECRRHGISNGARQSEM